MNGAALQYERDTEIADVDDTPPIAMGRVATEDLTVQVWLFGQWHRKMADADETACEVPFHLAGTRTRREQLTHADGLLCGGCFTVRELRKASENDKRSADEEERRRQREDIDSLFKAMPRMKRPTEGDR